MVLHPEDIGVIRPIDLFHIAPGFITRSVHQRTAQFRRKTRLPAPHQLRGFLLEGASVEAADAVHDLVVRPDRVLRVLPGPEAKIGHQPDSRLWYGARQHPHGVRSVRDVLDLVLDGEDELDVAPRRAVAVCDQRAVHGAQYGEDLAAVVLAAGARCHDVQVAVVDERPRHAVRQWDVVELIRPQIPLGLPVGCGAVDVLEEPREGAQALVPVEGFVVGVAGRLELPRLGGRQGIDDGLLRAGQTAGALEGSRGFTGAVTGGDELGQQRVDVVPVGVDAIPDDEGGGQTEQREDVERVEQAGLSKAPSRAIEERHGGRAASLRGREHGLREGEREREREEEKGRGTSGGHHGSDQTSFLREIMVRGLDSTKRQTEWKHDAAIVC